MSKYRKTQAVNVAYGFLGRTQDESETLQGFQEIADLEGWNVVVIHEQFESVARELTTMQQVKNIVGEFISERWIKSLPSDVRVIHRGSTALSSTISSVSLDLKKVMRLAMAHFGEMGYAQSLFYSPKRMADMAWVRSRESLREHLLTQQNLGILCASDTLARQGIHLAGQLGLRVPEDVGFIGMGNRRLDRLLAGMEISSFPEPNREIGQALARLLKDQLGGVEPKQLYLSPGNLIPRESSRKENQKPNLKSRIDELIAMDLANPPPVADWAKQVGMSRRSFENAFSSIVGMTPYAYLLHLRIAEAKRLLNETDLTIANVGAAIGIPDPPRFSAFFRKTTGTTASEWREIQMDGQVVVQGCNVS